MRWYGLFLIIFFVAVSGQQKTVMVFSRDEKSLSKCIEDSFSRNNETCFEDIRIKEVADKISRRFSRTSRSKNEFIKTVYYVMHHLKTSKVVLSKNKQLLRILLRNIQNALEECVDDEADPPKFNEPIELARVLDLILVEWQLPLQDMIRSVYGIALLRRYAREGRVSLQIALNSMINRELFRIEIRNLWMRRAQLCFNIRRRLPYILHLYTMQRGLRTYGNINFLSTDNNIGFSLRNPLLQQHVVYEFLNIHEANRPPYVNNDIFAEYDMKNQMTNAHLYIETRIDRFYRILYFVRELETSANLRSIEDEIYPVPNDILQRGINEMIYNDRVYRETLISQRICLNKYLERYSTRSQIEMGQILSSDQIFQEYLNLLGIGYDRSSMVTMSCSRANDLSPLPQFYFESDELRVLLDYILVDWDRPLYFMVRDRDGRELLRQYASEARAALECVLKNPLNRIVFRTMIRRNWFHRALFYFDGRRNDELQYIPHRYILNRGLYTTVGLQVFYHRDVEGFEARNPPITDGSRIYRFLQSHPPNYGGLKDNLLRRYGANGMSSVEYYFETHIDQFYRIIFFFNELSLRGFSDDVFPNEPLPYGVISPAIYVDLRELLYNNDAYGSYLLALQNILQREIADDEMLQIETGIVLSSAPVHEENFIFNINLLNHLKSTTRNTTTTSTTKVFSFTSTTPKYDQLDQSDMAKDQEKKQFCKRSRVVFFEESQQQKFQNNNHNNYHYGFITKETNSSFKQKICILNNQWNC